MPQIAEAQALLAALGKSEQMKAEVTQQRRLARLNVAYGNALFAARGFGAPKTTAAFARARGSAHADRDVHERLAAEYGVWAGSYVRGELLSMRAHAEAFLNDVRATPNSPEAGIGLRICGVTHQFAGEYTEARSHLGCDKEAEALLERGASITGRDREGATALARAAQAGKMKVLALLTLQWR
jgi:hypothetical protein